MQIHTLSGALIILVEGWTSHYFFYKFLWHLELLKELSVVWFYTSIHKYLDSEITI